MLCWIYQQLRLKDMVENDEILGFKMYSKLGQENKEHIEQGNRWHNALLETSNDNLLKFRPFYKLIYSPMCAGVCVRVNKSVHPSFEISISWKKNAWFIKTIEKKPFYSNLHSFGKTNLLTMQFFCATWSLSGNSFRPKSINKCSFTLSIQR